MCFPCVAQAGTQQWKETPKSTHGPEGTNLRHGPLVQGRGAPRGCQILRHRATETDQDSEGPSIQTKGPQRPASAGLAPPPTPQQRGPAQDCCALPCPGLPPVTIVNWEFRSSEPPAEYELPPRGWGDSWQLVSLVPLWVISGMAGG